MLTIDDAEALFVLMNQLDQETEYMMYEPGERVQKSGPDRLRENIQRGSENGDFMMAAVEDHKIVGFLWAERGAYRRIAHTAYLVTGILKAYHGQGIGSELFRQLSRWAEQEKILRLELTVQCRNEVALHLYQKMGFQIEGVKKNSMVVNGEFVDEYYMART